MIYGDAEFVGIPYETIIIFPNDLTRLFMRLDKAPIKEELP